MRTSYPYWAKLSNLRLKLNQNLGFYLQTLFECGDYIEERAIIQRIRYLRSVALSILSYHRVMFHRDLGFYQTEYYFTADSIEERALIQRIRYLHSVALSILSYHRVMFHRDPWLAVRDPTLLIEHQCWWDSFQTCIFDFPSWYVFFEKNCLVW